VFTHARVHDNVPCTCLQKWANRRFPTHHKPSAGMPGPEGPAHMCWLGVVTGIRLIRIIAAATAERHGGFLVYIGYNFAAQLSGTGSRF